MGDSDDRDRSDEGASLDAEGSPFVFSYAVDDVALAALALRVAESEEAPRCHACSAAIEGELAGSGLFVWTRGDEVRREEPPLCPSCAAAIGLTALRRWAVEDDEEG